MRKHIIMLPVFFVLVLVLAACAKAPLEEMNAANDAVTRAENDANAVNYAGNTLIRARDVLTRMQSEADARRFDAAKSLASEAISLAERAIADGRTAAARARDEAANFVGGLAAPLAETANALGAARQVSNLNLDIDSLEYDLDSAYQTFDNAQRSLAAENYGDAITQGQNVRSLLSGINTRLNTATQATLRK